MVGKLEDGTDEKALTANRRFSTYYRYPNWSPADDAVEVFRALHQARFPIEEMRVIDAPELDLPPTGDGNVTSAFVCRPTRGSSTWSEHAYGRAIDVNPFQNPYQKGDVVLPEGPYTTGKSASKRRRKAARKAALDAAVASHPPKSNA